MNEQKGKWGKKKTCPCPRAKNQFTPLLDDHGNDSGAGKCWSPACDQKFYAPPTPQPHHSETRDPYTLIRHHVYQTAEGMPLLRITVTKYPNGSKRAFAEHWDGAAWSKGVDGVERVLYRLPHVIDRISQGGTITICEGEKDCDAAADIGITATTNPFGAEKWLDSMSEVLRGARVTIIPDLDDPGWKHARLVEQSLKDAGVAAVGVLDLRALMPDLPAKSDLSDYLDRGGDPEALRLAIEAACTNATAVEAAPSALPAPKIAWETLPNILQELVEPVEDERQRVALLMAAITVIGSIVPGVKTCYDGQYYSPSLYLFVLGPPGSGKGSITPAELIIREIDRELSEASKVELKMYEQELAHWKAQGAKIGEPPPDKPVRRSLRLSADSTGSVIIRATCNNPSVLVFDTEGDTLSIALRPDSIDASSALRKAWHHERIDQERVTDSLHVATDRPHFSMVLSGTPNQVLSLVKHVESGLTSRICFIEFPPQKTFRNPFKEGNDRVHRLAKTMQRNIRDLWKFVSDYAHQFDFIVELTESQQERHVHHFKQRFEDEIEGADEGATLRSGIVAVRIITALTVIRHWYASKVLESVMVATDDDFTLGLELAEFLRKGTDNVIQRLAGQARATPPTQTKRKNQQWYEALPAQFTTPEATDLGRRYGIGRSTVFKLLGQESHFEKLAHGHYKKQLLLANRGP